MKRDFLKATVPGITEEQLKAIMDENGKDIEAGNKAKEQLAAKDQEITGLKSQITQLNGSIEELKKSAGDNEALKTQITQMQEAHKGEVDKLNGQLAQQAYDHAADAFFAGVKFKSSFAKSAIMADFKSKGYKLEDGKFIGSDGYLEAVKKADPSAFEEDAPPTQPAPSGPQFTRQLTNNPQGKAPNKPLPGLFFQSVRNVKTEE